MNLAKRFAALALLGAGSLMTGCAGTTLVRVQPWERGTLADQMMDAGRDSLGSMMSEHVYFARENASGGRGVGGSGCGCNG